MPYFGKIMKKIELLYVELTASLCCKPLLHNLEQWPFLKSHEVTGRQIAVAYIFVTKLLLDLLSSRHGDLVYAPSAFAMPSAQAHGFNKRFAHVAPIMAGCAVTHCGKAAVQGNNTYLESCNV